MIKFFRKHILFAVSALSIFMIAGYLNLVYSVPTNPLNLHIEASHETDYLVLIVAFVTFIIAVFTLLITWFIKTEARDIGDKIILNDLIQRKLDRILYEYSVIHYKNFNFAKDQALEMHHLDDIQKQNGVRFAVCMYVMVWFNQFYYVDEGIRLLKNITPGIVGSEYAEYIGLSQAINTFNRNSPPQTLNGIVVRNKEDFFEKLARGLITETDKCKIYEIGIAIHKIMTTLGWMPLLDEKNLNMENELYGTI